MPSVNFSPIFNGWQGFTPSGLPLTGGFVYTYVAGTSTPLPTYTTNAGNVANSNPIALLSDGRPPQEIWLDAAYSYKFILTDSLLNPIATYDNITGIDNSVPAALSEWVVSGLTPAYSSATTFTLAGNQTTLFQVGRRVRYTLNSGQFTGSITSSVFGAVTTVVLATDSIPLDNTLSAVDYGLLNSLKPSVPTAFQSAVTAPSATFAGAVVGNGNWTIGGAAADVVTVNGTATFPLAATSHTFGATFGNADRASLTTFDWYEEKTSFSPFVVPASGSGITYITQKGVATRIGNRVFFDLWIGITGLGTASGNIYIAGLPWNSKNYGAYVFDAYIVNAGYATNLSGLTGAMSCYVFAGTDRVYLNQWGATGITSLTASNLTTSTSLIISGAYPA